ncbi:Nif3-like dinuclear metal center hexameric protein [Candidatus Hydrogenedentota bacterium]
MKASQIMAHFQEVGTWVNWEATNDHFLHGDPEIEVKGIATAWIPSNKAIKQVAEKGFNLFIVHEPSFYPRYEGSSGVDELIREKRALLDERGITLMRCHDTWDRMPEYGIPDAWATFLGFPTEARPVESFYKTCLLDSLTVEEAASAILEKVRSLGQDTVLIFGDRTRKVKRMAIGTGAITNLPKMHELGVDAILATDDGTNSVTGGLWSMDMDVPFLTVNHATAEKPGMQMMATYLTKVFPEIPAEYVDVDLPYTAAT